MRRACPAAAAPHLCQQRTEPAPGEPRSSLAPSASTALSPASLPLCLLSWRSGGSCLSLARARPCPACCSQEISTAPCTCRRARVRAPAPPAPQVTEPPSTAAWPGAQQRMPPTPAPEPPAWQHSLIYTANSQHMSAGAGGRVGGGELVLLFSMGLAGAGLGSGAGGGELGGWERNLNQSAHSKQSRQEEKPQPAAKDYKNQTRTKGQREKDKGNLGEVGG